ncbi:MAG: hypothetical protein KY455_04490 [Euryarchaeota archaeon]|nr:hypothetical protein [Euryarchaeota archaeon]
MNKVFIAAALALALAGGAVATGAQQNTNYVTAGYAATGIWCKDGGHNYAPIGDPGDYGSELAWLFSGEPECLPGDVAFGTEDDHAWMAAALCVAGEINGEDCGDHRTHDLLVTSNDAIGTPHLFISAETCDGTEEGDCTTQNNKGENVVAEGCGASGLPIPADMPRHWQSPADAPTYLIWTFIDGAFVDETSGAICLGSTGTITADF